MISWLLVLFRTVIGITRYRRHWRRRSGGTGGSPRIPRSHISLLWSLNSRVPRHQLKVDSESFHRRYVERYATGEAAQEILKVLLNGYGLARRFAITGYELPWDDNDYYEILFPGEGGRTAFTLLYAAKWFPWSAAKRLPSSVTDWFPWPITPLATVSFPDHTNLRVSGNGVSIGINIQGAEA